jgi:hypothetical protein
MERLDNIKKKEKKRCFPNQRIKIEDWALEVVC